ncbi:MAG TPA: branched-chain amino acid ABC transporter substrate-binding protein [Acetobacteraceae bacterium]|nr:branched-chain amino acid ABC transporter substrate-binding protein [Acetobacteraceae bacterium]
MQTISRRDALRLIGTGTAVFAACGRAAAADKVLTIGMSFPLTGSLALQAGIARDAVLYAIDEANDKGGVAGYKIQALVLNDASTTTGQYDPAIAATNARKMLQDDTVIAAVGPLNSGSAKAVSPVLSQGGMATISGSATNPDLTSPKFAAVYRPAGPPIFFRTVTTDAYQGPNFANFLAEERHIQKVTVLDDSGAYGVGMADAFAAQAMKKGMTVVIRDRLDPLNADYTAILTRAKSLGTQALYYGGDPLAGTKVVKQSYEIIPDAVKGGGDGVHTPDMLTGGAMPAINGWYATSAAAHVLDEPQVQPWVQRYVAKTGKQPADYTITYYDATRVVLAAIARAAGSGHQVTRATVRDAIQATKLDTLQGPVSFDENGDLTSKTVSIFQVQYDPNHPIGDVIHQFKYVGVAPEA